MLRRPEGRIQAGGVARYPSSYVDPMVSPGATAATLRLIAR